MYSVVTLKNPNKHSVMLNRPDYTFLDKRPVPLGSRQFVRLKEQQGYAVSIEYHLLLKLVVVYNNLCYTNWSL